MLLLPLALYREQGLGLRGREAPAWGHVDSAWPQAGAWHWGGDRVDATAAAGSVGSRAWGGWVCMSLSIQLGPRQSCPAPLTPNPWQIQEGQESTTPTVAVRCLCQAFPYQHLAKRFPHLDSGSPASPTQTDGPFQPCFSQIPGTGRAAGNTVGGEST